MFNWIEGYTNHSIVTLYANNFTLNNLAASYFKDYRWCCIGINEIDKQVAIKPVSKREIDLNIVPLTQLHKVSIGKGYGRISNKVVLDMVSTLLNETLNGQKFMATFDEKEKMLVIDLTTQIK